MKCEVSEICGDWALDINNFNGGKITIYFNSRQNALNVKRILEVDDSIPILDLIYPSGIKSYNCPVCGKGSLIGGNSYYPKYCSNCGQALDWSYIE